MLIMIPGERDRIPARPAMVGPHHPRKVGLIGGSSVSLLSAPWQDPSWEFWSHASVVAGLPEGRCQRLFDIHPKHCFTEERKHGFVNYYEFLQRCPTPIYMQEHYKAIPSSVKYPLDLIKQQWPGTKFGSITAYMIALALLEGVTTLGLFGIDYQHESEYAEQRVNTEHWVGIAKGAGVQIIIPRTSPLCHEPALDYGYESHATVELYEARKAKMRKYRQAESPKGGPFDTRRLVPADQRGLDVAAELRRTKDPEWAKAIANMADVEPDWLPKIGMPVQSEG
jgi:hypothetical protein